MCGFCGELASSNQAGADAISAMNDALQSRGPNGAGIFLQDRFALGHRRLSIIDLTPMSHQPMVDAELGLAVAFNGCIYNYRELRGELQEMGFRFFSEGDTEVILKAYAAWGTRCVERFFGMFAFALWERKTGRLLLARDRLGIKPLYYADVDGRFRFASTLPALLAAGDIDTAIDPAALHHYMSLHAVVPAPRTILKGVRKLPPATIMIIEPDGKRTEERYWRADIRPRSEDRHLTAAEWRDAVVEAMAKACERRRVADVPVGVLLSGGLDSSLLVALLADKQPDLKTFSIGFDALKDVEGDEFKYSNLVARHFGTSHQRIVVDAQRTLDALPQAIAAMSEPMMSHDSVAFHILSEEVSRHVKVVQCGQGADEVFGGYHWYQTLAGSNDPVSDYARVYFDRDHDEMGEALTPEHMNGDYSREFIEDFFGESDSEAAIEKILHLDLEIMLADDPVKRVDNMTMAFGVEARVPFLDHEVVELAARIPTDLKLRDGGKAILKDAARGSVPSEIIDRPKGYFPVPALKYIQGPFLDFVRDVLEQPAARERNLFNRSYVDRLLADPEGELTPKGNSKLWQIASLELWLQSHRI